MADLDTRAKRASSVNLAKPYVLALALPDGTIGQGDRQHSAWSYSSILATALGGSVGDIFRAAIFASRVLRRPTW